MAMSRMAVRTVFRRYSTEAVGPSASGGDHKGGLKLWKRLFFAVAVPGIIACGISGFEKEHEHKAHWHQPEYKEYAHLQIRSKPFPWGDGNHSLFHHPQFNIVPGVGYEEEYKSSHE